MLYPLVGEIIRLRLGNSAPVRRIQCSSAFMYVFKMIGSQRPRLHLGSYVALPQISVSSCDQLRRNAKSGASTPISTRASGPLRGVVVGNAKGHKTPRYTFPLPPFHFFLPFRTPSPADSISMRGSSHHRAGRQRSRWGSRRAFLSREHMSITSETSLSVQTSRVVTALSPRRMYVMYYSEMRISFDHPIQRASWYWVTGRAEITIPPDPRTICQSDGPPSAPTRLASVQPFNRPTVVDVFTLRSTVPSG
ncbi:hypothetical protein PM082_000808 [Marasmius tenuissimus]|nr:hypothetical protein PM082_000808 [Marasmius tenuissimus]